MSAYRTRPLLVVLPKQMEQVTAILAVCHRLRVPVVTRGGGTGLSGGAAAGKRCVVGDGAL
ncbi:FAD-binding protein [Escherichia coli]|uniref:FAD-binding protein n=1 Tax=Escherichia coli TaxID=562 RepID=UPI002238676C|nr:FAD-binding protein [Escherichia coli]MCW7301207.1 FAD-binding protein [Escherichia coli]